jgi:tetratricopeptide (TPR) repeat protein
LGLIGLAVGLAGFVYAKTSLDHKRLWLVVGAGLFFLLTSMSYNYAGVFANEYEMWTYTLRANPNAWQAHSRLGKVMIERGENDSAFFHFSKAVRLRPDLAETHNNYGDMLEKRGDIEGAVTQFKMAVERGPDVPLYKINLGSLLMRLRRYQEGKEVYLALLKMDPSNAIFLRNLGIAQYFVGENDAAIESFQKALQINSNLQDARDNLNQALRVKNGTAEPPALPLPPQS